MIAEGGDPKEWRLVRVDTQDVTYLGGKKFDYSYMNIQQLDTVVSLGTGRPGPLIPYGSGGSSNSFQDVRGSDVFLIKMDTDMLGNAVGGIAEVNLTDPESPSVRLLNATSFE